MRIVCMSDTHNTLHKITFAIPDGDVFLFTGDLTGSSHNMCGVSHFNEFINELPHKHKVIIAGNHDYIFEEKMGGYFITGKNVHYLEDSGVTIDGLNFYGSPYQPSFCDMAFNISDPLLLRRKWDNIPKNTDILLTHCAPYGILDRNVDGDSVGCPMLRDRILKLKQLKVHCFGHVHESYGMTEKNGVIFVNSSTCDIDYHPVNQPIVIDI